ncbi:MAG: hypothetical protein DHS20C18_41100 [Saprospiraceae bacterium]|nr:MAG: hypothetical protein DHS20C18_41100 [Saprospiraceae bacterium]
MKSLIKDYKSWLFNNRNTALFNCEIGECSCEIFHLLAPILHDIGLIRSYNSYDSEIRKITSGIILGPNETNILVAGIDSELSARALIQALGVFERKYSITFLDCCPTPLLRIKESLEEHEKEYIETKLIDIFSPLANQLHSKFDIIFADSFIKQFSKAKKTEVLKILSNTAKTSNSLIIIREFLGDLDELLPRLWKQLDHLLNQKNFSFLTSPSDLKKFYLLINRLDEYYKNTGEIYRNPEELKSDLRASGLQLVEEYFSEGRADRIIVAQRL